MKKLSKNEQQVLNLMYKGLKNKEIAQSIKSKKGEPLSEKTVSTYALRIRKKMNIPLNKNTFYLVTKAIKLNLIKNEI